MEQIEQKVSDILIKAFHLEPEEITPQANLRSDLEMDSTEVVELVVSLEKEFGIKLKDGEVTNKHSVADIIEAVRSKTA